MTATISATITGTRDIFSFPALFANALPAPDLTDGTATKIFRAAKSELELGGPVTPKCLSVLQARPRWRESDYFASL